MQISQADAKALLRQRVYAHLREVALPLLKDEIGRASSAGGVIVTEPDEPGELSLYGEDGTIVLTDRRLLYRGLGGHTLTIVLADVVEVSEMEATPGAGGLLYEGSLGLTDGSRVCVGSGETFLGELWSALGRPAPMKDLADALMSGEQPRFLAPLSFEWRVAAVNGVDSPFAGRVMLTGRRILLWSTEGVDAVNLSDVTSTRDVRDENGTISLVLELRDGREMRLTGEDAVLERLRSTCRRPWWKRRRSP